MAREVLHDLRIENIFVCIAIPMLLSLFFTEHRQRVFTLLVIAGMGGSAVLAADAVQLLYEWLLSDQRRHRLVIEITPVCEEVMKSAPSGLTCSDL
ncbi:MAG: hypothetical protein ACLTSZ_11590 [Lachnospiraceae bacterium]